MTPPKTKIFVTRRLPAPIEARMATLFDTQLNDDDSQLGSDAIIAGLWGKDVLVSSITDRLDADFMERLPTSVKLIAQFGNGFDNIDVEAAYARGVTVTNTPSVLTEDTGCISIISRATGARRPSRTRWGPPIGRRSTR
jgi:glyoxylate reductase